jgi:hypothetical protein
MDARETRRTGLTGKRRTRLPSSPVLVRWGVHCDRWAVGCRHGVYTAVSVIGVVLVAAGCTAGSGSTASAPGQPAASTPVSQTSATSPAARPAATKTAAPAKPAAVRPTASSHGRCRGGDPLANVYHSYRLVVRSACVTVTGTVAYVVREDDGDVHVDLALPGSETGLLNQANYAHQDGQLVTEIVPADQPGCTPGQPALPSHGSYDYGICTGADLVTPSAGATVSVTGPYVLDADHGWMEIHPVWSITVLASAGTAPAPGPPTSASAPATASPPASPAAQHAWCTATASPANDGYSGDYEMHITSDQPDQEATASDAGDTWHERTDSSGETTITLWHTSPGETITVTVGAASCSASA